MYENMVEICYYNDFSSLFRLWDIVEFYVLHGRDIRKMPDDLRVASKEYAKMMARKIIEDAINNTIEKLLNESD